MFVWCCVFFFKQKTAYEMRISDWSSDVCSSDLKGMAPGYPVERSGRGYDHGAAEGGGQPSGDREAAPRYHGDNEDCRRQVEPQYEGQAQQGASGERERPRSAGRAA